MQCVYTPDIQGYCRGMSIQTQAIEDIVLKFQARDIASIQGYIHPEFTWFDSSYRRETDYFSEKRYIFIKEGGKKEYDDKLLDDNILFTSPNLDKIALKVTDSHVENFAEKLEQLSKSKYCSKPVKLITEKLSKEIITATWRIVGIKKEENLIKLIEIRKHQIWDSSIKKYTGFNYYITHRGTLQLKNNKLTKNSNMSGIAYGENTRVGIMTTRIIPLKK